MTEQYPDWFLSQPFRPPEPQGPGEATAELLFVEVGRISHTWEQLEGALYDLFLGLLTHAHLNVANLGAYSAVYSAMVSSSTRRDVLESIVSVSFHPDSTAYKRLRPIFMRVGRAIGRRNDAVHGIVVRYNQNGLFIMPPRYAALKPSGWRDGFGFRYRYDAATLRSILAVITALKSEIECADNDLKIGHIGQQPDKPPEPIPQ